MLSVNHFFSLKFSSECLSLSILNIYSNLRHFSVQTPPFKQRKNTIYGGHPSRNVDDTSHLLSIIKRVDAITKEASKVCF